MALVDQNYNNTLIFRLTFFFLLLLLQSPPIFSASSEAEILAKFKETLTNNGALSNWDKSVQPCKDNSSTWTGIICDEETVFGLQLENLGLKGTLDLDGLQELPLLRTLSFTHNDFEGPLPDFKNLKKLKAIYLSYNKFSGEISHNAFDGMASLKKLYLDHNQFSGPIPVSLIILPKLAEVTLENNQFEGEIPSLWRVTPKMANFSNNQLEGKIPDQLQPLNTSSFSGFWNRCCCQLVAVAQLQQQSIQIVPHVPFSAMGGRDMLSNIWDPMSILWNPINTAHLPKKGYVVKSWQTAVGQQPIDCYIGSKSIYRVCNNGLCGRPLEACPTGEPISAVTIVITVIVIVAALAGIASAFVVLKQRKQTQPETKAREGSLSSVPAHKKAASADLDKLESGEGTPEHHSSSGRKADQSQKLSFLRDDRERFDLPDLLKASAEILGSGVFGSTYKAALNNGQVVVVKRFRQMNNVGKEDFQEHMRRLGRLRHPNVLSLVAYYYRKEEKLLVTDYVDNVSLAVHLHGNHSHGNPSPDWPTRLKIVKGVAKGLLYLYNELPSLVAPHGHLKSSNVLLNKKYEPLLTDYGLVPITNQEQAEDIMIAYKSPEYKQNNRITKKTDVWSLGILILEILTGKFPENSLQQGKGSDTDLATLVNSVFRDELTGDVFDKDMGGYDKNNEGEMVKLLKIGLSCCEADVDKRWDMKEALERIEEVKEKEGDEEFYSSYGSERDIRSRGMSDDFSYG